MLKHNRNSLYLITLLVVLILALSVAVQAQDLQPTLAQRLAKLTADLESMRQELHIPGMAIGVVQGDELIYSQGFGMANIEEAIPVTPKTLFAIGSSSKAFTASLVGMMVDEGKMNWDDPVTRFLPYFKLNIDSDDPEAEVTIRDLLAHRTGFTRMGLLWAGGKVSREDVLRTATGAEPWAPFREKFYYNNVAFLAAGMAAGVAADSSWDRLLAGRLFSPLGMKSSSSSIKNIQDDPRLSLGYIWREETQEYEHLPMRSLDTIGPAGSINSNVLNMAQWLRFQLGRGTFSGNILLSAAQHAETWTPQMEISPGTDYGLGWMMHTQSGHPVVEHGGNIDGFAAQVTLFPESDLGFVLLCNVTATPLQGLSATIVAEALLDDWITEEDASPSPEDIAIYAGRYEANFGPFKDTFFTVSVNENRLFIDVPGQTNYQLEMPDEEGKWYFSLTNEIAVAFDRLDDNSVAGLTMYQAGMTFELPREGVQQVAEIDISELQPYLGTYHSDTLNLDFEVKVSNQRLAVDVPGEMVYELHLPNEDGQWVFRAVDVLAVTFTESANGAKESMKLFKNGALVQELFRALDPEAVSLPSVEEILALRKVTGDSDGESYRIKYNMKFVHSGVEGSMVYTSDGKQSYRSDTELGRFGWIHQVVDESQGWIDSNLQPFQKLEGIYRSQAMIGNVLLFGEDWVNVFDKITVTGSGNLGERKVYKLQLHAGELPVIAASVDAETGDLLRYEMGLRDPNLGIVIPTVGRNEDFRDINGMWVPHRCVMKNEFAGETVLEFEDYEMGVTITSEYFQPPTGGNGGD